MSAGCSFVPPLAQWELDAHLHEQQLNLSANAIMDTAINLWIWIGFSIFVVFALSIDTFLLSKGHSRPHESMRAALNWTIVWVCCAFLFNGLLWLYLYETTTLAIANEKGLAFFTGYLIEKSLSFDNLFAFYMVFHQFRIPVQYQQRVFSYGIWSAIILRLILILIGSKLVAEYHWILYIMGAFLVLTGFKMFFVNENEKDLTMSKTFQWMKKHLRITHELQGPHFFVRKNKHLYCTPLFVSLVFIELTDVVFAFDSIPAIFAITTDPFIIWTSNIFAILGLRALYFIISGMVHRFHLLKYGIALILVFVGGKMLIEPWFHISVGLSLAIVTGILILFSLLSSFQSARRK